MQNKKIKSISASSLKDNYKQDFSNDENEDRGNWTGRMDFLCVTITGVIGLGNIWKFPYLCFKFGPLFFIAYAISLLFVGIPMVFLQLSLGQFTSYAALNCFDFFPLIAGIGWSYMAICFITSIYYQVMVSWTLRYVIDGFINLGKPILAYCDNSWNTPNCSIYQDKNITKYCLDKNVHLTYNTTIDENGYCVGSRNLTFGGKSQIYNKAPFGNFNGSSSMRIFLLPTWEYFEKKIINNYGYDWTNFGTIQYEIAMCLLFLWLITFLALSGSIKSYGKVCIVCLFFIVILIIILLIRGLSLEGSGEGIKFFYKSIHLKDLQNAEIWASVFSQTFFSLSLSIGFLLMSSSYNRFHNNILRDSLIVCLTDFIISIASTFLLYSFLGLLATKAKNFNFDLINPGHDLIFVIATYAFSYVPNGDSWSILFFLLITLLGWTTILAMISTIIFSIVDKWLIFKTRSILFSLLICCIVYILALPLCCNGGIYLLILIDSYLESFSYITAAIFFIGITYVYGGNRFLSDIELMISNNSCFFLPWSIVKYWWLVMWGLVTPISCLVVFFYSMSKYETTNIIKWVETLGWSIAIAAFIPIFIYAIGACIYFSKFKSIKEAFKPSKFWGPYLLKHRQQVIYADDFELNPHQIVVF